VRVLEQLEDRARKRGRQDGPRVVNPVAELRKSHAAVMGGKRRLAMRDPAAVPDCSDGVP